MSAESTPSVRDEILTDIAAHMRVHGSTNWHMVWNRYPTVFAGCEKGSAGERKFFRWVKKVQEGVGEGVKTAREDAVRLAKTMVGKNLPATPPPSYLASHGAKGRANIDFLSMLHTVIEDIENLRVWSLKKEKDPDTGEMRVQMDPTTGRPVILNPSYFDGTIKRRLDTIETALKIMQEVWDLQRMQRFYDEIVSIIAEEIVPVEPEIARRIMERLQALNDAEAMTPNARPTAGEF